MPTSPGPTQSSARQVTLDVAGQTDVGRERERNEDQFLIATLQRNMLVKATSLAEAAGLLPGSAEGTVMLVADGMGGTEGGHVASAIAVRVTAEYVCNVLPWAEARARASSIPSDTLPGVRDGLQSALKRGDAEVKREAAHRGATTMGTTLTLAYLLWPNLYVAHAGDSRCYLLRQGELFQLTKDHTLAERFREQTSQPIDDSSPWHHVLWNALGGGKHASIEPEVLRRVLRYGDALLLCSDGLNKHVTDDEIATALQSAQTAAEACARLIAMANADGGSDNTTVVVAHCRSVDPETVDFDAPTEVLGIAQDDPTTKVRKS